MTFTDEERKLLISIIDFVRGKLALLPKSMLPAEIKNNFDKLPKLLENLSTQLKNKT